jgi:HK97 family phage major capsid protein
VFNRGINTTTKAGADDNVTALAKVIATTQGSANVAPDGIIMHPTNWLSTRLTRAGTAGDYLGGGPMTSGGGGDGLFGQTLWGLPVVLTNNVGAGTALVGSFGLGAHIWRRGGISVEASNSHLDWFQRNLTAIRAENREALGVYRPAAFTSVAGLT